MKILLEEIRMKNFKGFKERTIKFKQNTKIEGENESGKTSLFDAFTYVLFDKDSNYKSTFDIKPQDELGNEIHHLETIVEAKLKIDKDDLILKKIFTEKWVKPRGQKDSVFSGHTTDYFINNAPKKKSEYDTTITGLIKEDIFKLLTDPFYFNTVTHWTDRRKILQDIVGSVDQEQIMDSNKNLLELKDYLIKYDSFDDMKNAVAYEKKKYKKQLKDIPPRVDELTNNLIEMENNKSFYQGRIDGSEDKIKKLERKMIDSSGVYEENNKVTKQIYDNNAKLNQFKNKFEEKNSEEKRLKRNEVKDFENEIKDIEKDRIRKIKKMKAAIPMIDEYEDQLMQLRKEYDILKIDLKNFEDDIDTEEITIDAACPTCGQDLPKEDIKAKQQEIVATLKKNKLKEKESIIKKKNDLNKKGVKIKKEKENLEKEHAQLKIDIEKLVNDFMAADKKIEDSKISLEEAEKEVFKPNKEYKTIEKDIKKLKEQITEVDESFNDKLKEKIKGFRKEIDGFKDNINNFKMNERSKNRIKELLKEEKELVDKIVELEKKEFLVEDFERTQADYLEQLINDHFGKDIVQFKLFENQVNGGLNEVCTALVRNEKGILVPFDSANNAGKINAGIEIINVLTKHFNFKAPIFIDNAESINKIRESESQKIELYVADHGVELGVI